ncbi:MAG: hypothetical protein RLZZ292_3837 [Bacteroidota bacterium]|jgi:SAM-dependent methyltransferase
MINTKFINPSFRPSNIDTYFIRTSIYKALKANYQSFKGTFLDVSCGFMPYKEVVLENKSVEKYLGIDIDYGHDYGMKPDMYWTTEGNIPLPDASIDSAMATEVLEHCPNPQQVLNEVARVLKPEGFFFATVPFLWPHHEIPYDEHRYTAFALKRMMQTAGFQNITVQALGGWEASLAQVLGLWIRRRKKPKLVKIALSILFYPLIGLLIWLDKPPKEVGEGMLVTNFSITGNK